MAFFNTPAQVQQFQNFTPQQQNALDQLLSMGLGKVNNQQQFDFAPIEQKARTEFQTNTIQLSQNDSLPWAMAPKDRAPFREHLEMRQVAWNNLWQL